jgi:hypothetical protein
MFNFKIYETKLHYVIIIVIIAMAMRAQQQNSTLFDIVHYICSEIFFYNLRDPNLYSYRFNEENYMVYNYIDYIE